jgi:hypothetical protein
MWSAVLFCASAAQGAPKDVSFSQSAQTVEAYDFVEVALRVEQPDASSPFTDVAIEGQFGKPGGEQVSVEGFCDSADGALYRIRFMPSRQGEYAYAVTYRQGDFRKTHTGVFRAVNGNRRGILRVDAQYPWHFLWEGTGEHYFFNGTTAFYLMGWQDEKVIEGIIDRLHRLQVNRIRIMLAARSSTFWGEPVVPGRGFRISLNPWVAQRPDDVTNPGFDYTRFNLPYWQKVERMLRYARERDMILSVVFDWNDSKVHPAAGSEDELRYFRYGAVRLGAYSNVNWDLGDDITAYHNDEWAHQVGTLLKKWDAYRHLATDHPNSDREPLDRPSVWMDFTSFQMWRRPVHGWMVAQRRKQQALGRIIPQTNEEYGYEDHYPRGSSYSYPDGQSADANRRAAWEISMAGTYQTTGETAKRGTGVWPDTGGGWVNGRGDDTMVMLHGYAHMVHFFTSFEWWKAEPRDDLVDNGAYCLAEPGRLYAVYLPRGGRVTVKLEAGRYQATWFNARTGQTAPVSAAEGPAWTSPQAPDSGDWALLLKRVEGTSQSAAGVPALLFYVWFLFALCKRRLLCKQPSRTSLFRNPGRRWTATTSSRSPCA